MLYMSSYKTISKSKNSYTKLGRFDINSTNISKKVSTTRHFQKLLEKKEESKVKLYILRGIQLNN